MDSNYPLYRRFTVEEWSQLRKNTPMVLDEADLKNVRGINENISIEEAETVFLPISRLLNLQFTGAKSMLEETGRFLEHSGTGRRNHAPYIIGLAGSVAVGKSTAARLLQLMLQRWPSHPKVDLVSTDGFLHPNAALEERGIMDRKGFPESFDRESLLRFLSEIKSGQGKVKAPVYSHLVYDVVPDECIEVDRPDILIVEGLNVLQTGTLKPGGTDDFVSDYFDFSIYLDAKREIIRQWYIERFLVLCKTAFSDDRSYFHRYSELTEEEAIETADGIWTRINLKNLVENILPTRRRAGLILTKGANHRINEISLRNV